MQRLIRAWMLGLTILLLGVGCGGDNLGTATISTVEFNNLSRTSETFLGSSSFVSGSQTFTVPEGTVSFVLLAFSDSGSVYFTSLTNPDGTDLLSASTESEYEALFLRPSIDTRFAALLVPNVPTETQSTSTPSAGSWSFKVGTSSSSATVDVTISIRSNSVPTTPTIPVQPFLASGTYSASDLTTALNTAVTRFSNNGITMALADTIELSNEEYRTISPSFTNSTTSAMVSEGDANRLNVYFVDDFSGSFSGVLGLASNIPGPMGLAGGYNGVLVSVNSHLISGSLNNEELANTVVHEMGHFLGLYHTTESNGSTYDPIADTSECTESSPTAEACESADGTNLMFWSPPTDGSFVQTVFSTDQVSIMGSSVLVY